jgi:type I restriction enzyme R subunit
MSQFAFLQAEFPDIFAHATRAENLANSDPRAAAFDGRTQKKDSLAAPKTLPFNDFSHFAPCA